LPQEVVVAAFLHRSDGAVRCARFGRHGRMGNVSQEQEQARQDDGEKGLFAELHRRMIVIQDIPGNYGIVIVTV
jgi:hypothetical protein